MGTTVVIEGVMASELPEAWRQRVKAKFAGCKVPSMSFTTSRRRVFAYALSVFQV